ncbi:hypothetical protein SAMN05421743_10639 [Thalassobacillus cyri]|uniref:Uncharacterized protein n=1 Tax=Thalassobacillus cyri TaxID=571932 RepID=A0A1H4CFH5_9BACI|nr:hypothetical protein SAMN05421743_10639 [Thalassobacillus cyri]
MELQPLSSQNRESMGIYVTPAKETVDRYRYPTESEEVCLVVSIKVTVFKQIQPTLC